MELEGQFTLRLFPWDKLSLDFSGQLHAKGFIINFIISSGPVLWDDQHWHPSTELHCAVWHRLLQPLGALHSLLFPRFGLLWVCFFWELTCSAPSWLHLLATSWKTFAVFIKQQWLKCHTSPCSFSVFAFYVKYACNTFCFVFGLFWLPQCHFH